MKTEKRQNLTINLLLILLLAIFFLSVSLMWSKHSQYHIDGFNMGWMMSDNSTLNTQYLENSKLSR